MSRQETPTQNQSTGAHRKHRAPAGRARPDAVRRAQGTLPMQPPAHYEPVLDGLFTYCLSILCEHDAAAAALGEVLALAERQRGQLRDPRQRRPWLYALARWACLRRLAAGTAEAPPASVAVARERHAELAALAWPEAAGTTPEQREALELAVRHQLPPHEVGAVLGIDVDVARALLARAACEVERTRTALSVVDTGSCPAVAQLAGETKVLLGTALRTELVRHVDDCAECRRTAERVVAAGPWPGTATTGSTAVLALIEAPRSAAYAALLHAMEAGTGRSREATPRFDRRGFPMDLKDRAARRAQLRHRAVTTTVVAAVVAAPVLALWAAYRAAPLGADAPSGTDRAAASEPDSTGGLDGHPYEEAGSSRHAPPGHKAGSAPPALSTSVDVIAGPSFLPSGGKDGAGRLTVTARSRGGATAVTLTAGGAAPVAWSASTAAFWVHLSASGGTLRPGESVTVLITVDRGLEPAGSWTARIAFSPANATVVLRGTSTRAVPPPASSSPAPTSAAPSPSAPSPTTPPPSSPPPPTPSDSSPPPTASPSAS